MKRKIIFAIATSFFAMATVFNMNMLQVKSAGDLSLEGMTVIAQADPESPGNWYNRGVWTKITVTETRTVVISAAVYAMVNGVWTVIKPAVTKVVTREYTTWDCIGWSGRC